MKEVFNTFALFSHPKIRHIFFLGIASGLPFLLTLATLHVRLMEAHASKSMIGLFTLITLPYSGKFLWAPLVDVLPLPYLTKRWGQRRGWLILSQVGLFFSIGLLAVADPGRSFWFTAFAGILVAFCSATQDIIYEAYRIEILASHEMGVGASASMLGYRIGIWISGAGALYLAHFWGWTISFLLMALVVLLGIATTIVCEEPTSYRHYFDKSPYQERMKLAFTTLFKSESLLIIVAYIFFYKVGDTTLNVMTAPFLLDLGFDKAEIANVAKSFGIFTMVVGSILGSALLSSRPLIYTLLLASILHVFSCLMFCLQAQVGYNMGLLVATVALENLACGIGTSGIISYMSTMCKAPFSASHYALLSSLASLFRVLISNLLGFMADRYAWEEFYALMALACVPSFILLILCARHFSFRAKTVRA